MTDLDLACNALRKALLNKSAVLRLERRLRPSSCDLMWQEFRKRNATMRRIKGVANGRNGKGF